MTTPPPLISVGLKVPPIRNILEVRGGDDWVDLFGQRFLVSGDRTIVHCQLRAEADLWPAWRELQIVRHLPDGSIDATALETSPIVRRRNPQGWLYTVEMDTDPDTSLALRFRVGDDGEVQLVKRIAKVSCYAQADHDHEAEL